MTRGISEHYLYEYDQYPNFIEDMFHDGEMEGAYEDEQTWEGMGIPQEHFPMQAVNLDGIRPSYGVRYIARSWTLGIVVPLEDKRDDLYGIIHRFFPMAGGEFARSYYALEQILAAQFFGLYGFMSGTSVPFSPDGLSFFNTAHPFSKANQAQTYSNTPSKAADFSVATLQMADAAIRTQIRPNGVQKIPNEIARVIVHPNERIVAKQVLGNEIEGTARVPGTANWDRNYLGEQGIDLVANPYWEFSGTSGALASPAAFNSWFAQGRIHFCKWKKRSDLELFSRFDGVSCRLAA